VPSQRRQYDWPLRLGRGYWCHYSSGYPDEDGELLVVAVGFIGLTPGQALRWIRRSVRRITPLLDVQAGPKARDWLEDVDGFHQTLKGLQNGENYFWSLSTSGVRIDLTITPVTMLPLVRLVRDCPNR
jgi:hypothetical protein